jgi:signal transduction histidine kinase
MSRFGGLRERIRGHPFAVDGAVAVVLGALVIEDLFSSGGYYTASQWIYVPAALLMTLPLAWRRRRPLAVCLVVMGTLAGESLAVGTAPTPDIAMIAWLLAIYSAAAHCDRRSAVVAGVISIGAGLAWMGVDDYLLPVVVFGGAWIAGRLVRQLETYASALEERSEALERERELNARAAVAEERTRIARELHDIVAHTLGVMVVQAGAERLHEATGTPAHDALSSIEQSGRQALTEMGRLVAMLRTDTESETLGPQPGIDQLEALIGRIRETGLDVELVVEGRPRELAPGLDVSAYRIVQEALTNTLRHARSRRARVLMRWELAALHIEVADDGIGPTLDQETPGHGLMGIRERVALFGGALVTGRSDLGGYLLAATLPTST